MKKTFLSLLIVIIIYSLFFIHSRYFQSDNGQISGISTQNSSVIVSAFIGEFRFTLFGYTSPNALVTIDGMGIYDQTTADDTGYFVFKNRFSPLSPREACLTAKDQLGRVTAPNCLPPFPTKYDVEIGPILMPPTVSLNSEYYYQGDEIGLSGQTIPNSEVKFSIFADDIRGFEIADSRRYIKREDMFFETIAWVPFQGEAVEKNGIERFILSFFGLAKPVEAFSFPQLGIKADGKGNYSLAIPSSHPEFFRLFTQANYQSQASSQSIKLNLKIYPVWMIIFQTLYLIWSVIKARLLEFIILGEIIAITIFLLRRYTHPHVIARNRSLMLRERFSLMRSEFTPMSLTPYKPSND